MRAFLSHVLSRRRFGVLVGITALCLLIAVFGGWLIVSGDHPLASLWSRLLAILGVIAIWLLIEAFLWWRRVRADTGILRTVLNISRGSGHEAIDAELSDMRENFRDTVAMLNRDERKFVLNQPWYLIMGPAAAGKESLIRQSGLNMPFEERLGRRSIPTQQASLRWHWWFTDEALLLGSVGALVATAARDAPVLRGWREMLNFVQRRRPRRPLNGVIMVVPVDIMLNADGLQELAANIRRRLQEAMQRFASRLPVYIVVSQCDRLLGFTEFFGRLDADAQAQPFGVTVPATPTGSTGRHAALQEQLSALVATVGQQVVARSAIEPDPVTRARMTLFPEQLARLADAAVALGDTLVIATRTERPPLLRGVFLTSAGQPDGDAVGSVDGWGPRFGRPLGLASASMGAARRGGTGPFFISGLFRNLIFPEARVSGRSVRGESRTAILNGTGYALCLGLLLAGIGWCFTIYDRHSTALTSMRSDIKVERAMIPQTNPQTGVSAVLPDLDEAKQLASVDQDHREPWLPLSIAPLNIKVARKAAQHSYHRALAAYLLPAMTEELYRQLRDATAAGTNRSQIRSLLTTYLMLGDPKHFDRTRISAWANGIVQADFALAPEERTRAQGHVNALLAMLPLPVALDQSLISRARSELRQMPDADEAYARLKSIALTSSSASPLDVVNALGSAGAQLLMLRSQAGLPVVVPALYTRDGFYRIFLTEAPLLARGVDANDWVLGGTGGGSAQNVAAVLQAMTNYYVQDYVKQWQSVVSQISLRALPDLPSLSGGLQTMAGQDSPLIQFINLIKQQTDLDPPSTQATGLIAQATNAVAGAAGSSAGTAAASLAQKAADLAVPAVIPTDPTNWPGTAIRTPFVPLLNLVDAKSGQAPVLRVQNTLATAYGVVSGIASAQAPDAAAQAIAAQVLSGQGADPLVAMRVQAATLPRPIDTIFRQLYQNIWSTLMSLTVNRIEASWARDVAPACEQTIARRYPFVASGDPGAGRDVTMRDFSSFFGPNGTIDKFITTNLGMFTTIDADGRLSLMSQNGLSLGLSSTAMAQINRARAVRNLFFGSDGNVLVRFAITPTYLDPRVLSATLQSDQTRFVYRHEAPRAVPFTWPPTGDGGASFSMNTTNGDVQQVQTDGVWAIFRLLNGVSSPTTGNGAKVSLNFKLADYTASYQLRADSVSNPFADRDYTAFRCVPRL
ncbi:MAG: type VI secretion system membrane subunit TssM [Acetobacteraceae bacterium]